MRQTAGIFLAASIFLFAPVHGCATGKAAVGACVVDASLLDEVAADLASGDYVARLEALAVRVGLCIVDKTVAAVIAPSGAKADPVIVAHGEAWLAAHPFVAGVSK